MRIPKPVKTVLKRVHKFVFFDTFEFVLRVFPVNSERWFWMRELMMHFPGNIGTAYRSLFYNCYFKQRGARLAIVAGVCIEHPSGLEMGDGVIINRNCWFNAVGGITIGNHCAFGPGTIIHSANHNFGDPAMPFQEQGWTHKPVMIESDVWMAAGVIVLPGARIGRGAVIGAGSVVSGTIEPYAIVYGEKARTARFRKTADESHIGN